MKVVMFIKNRKGFFLSCVFVLIALTGFTQNSFQNKSISLNNDTIDSKLIKQIVKFAKTHKKIGYLGITNCYYNENWSELFEALDTLVTLNTIRLMNIRDFNIDDFLMNLPHQGLNLKYLDMINCNIDSLPNRMGRLINLAGLNLTGNNFDKLPLIITNLLNLRVLWMMKNKLTSIPKEITNLVFLVSLHLDSNNLRNIDDVFCEISNLKHLGLSFNNIDALPPCFIKLTKLYRIDLSNNNFTAYPDVLLEQTFADRWMQVFLTSNKIKEIPDKFYERNRKFMRLRLQNNKIPVEELKKLSKNEKIRSWGDCYGEFE